jgi:hypothetical protein
VSDETIRVGDLVVVVRGHQCNIGRIGRVICIDSTGLLQQCMHCGHVWNTEHPLRAVVNEQGGGWELHRLKRIDPLSEPSHTERREEIEA